jgi:alpha-ketoglutarate-dependent taurine dioxygenase
MLLHQRISLPDGFSALRSQGWVALGSESRDTNILTLASAFGVPVRSPTADFVRQLVPKDSTGAVAGTLSAKYGRADFPLHTDTAFWPVPARYLVMRVSGDTRRRTFVAPICQALHATIARDISSSVWIIRGGKPIYVSMKFRVNGEVGLRYDPLTMMPANRAAVNVQSGLLPLLADVPVASIDWADVGTIIIDNWRVLHGRGTQPEGEGQRVLERVYVR